MEPLNENSHAPCGLALFRVDALVCIFAIQEYLFSAQTRCALVLNPSFCQQPQARITFASSS